MHYDACYEQTSKLFISYTCPMHFKINCRSSVINNENKYSKHHPLLKVIDFLKMPTRYDKIHNDNIKLNPRSNNGKITLCVNDIRFKYISIIKWLTYYPNGSAEIKYFYFWNKIRPLNACRWKISSDVRFMSLSKFHWRVSSSNGKI